MLDYDLDETPMAPWEQVQKAYREHAIAESKDEYSPFAAGT